ncbi:MAG: hypothetical protein KA371_00495 [Acidobacteria bacterium]|nr:hypothetical protein [Acidobacteriota bacterium]
MTTPVVVRRPHVPEPSMHEARVTRRLRQLRRDALREVTQQRLRWRYRVRRGRMEFDREVSALPALLKQSVPAYFRAANPLIVLSAPVLPSARSSKAAVPECDREDELHVLHLRQRRRRLRP